MACNGRLSRDSRRRALWERGAEFKGPYHGADTTHYETDELDKSAGYFWESVRKRYGTFEDIEDRIDPMCVQRTNI